MRKQVLLLSGVVVTLLVVINFSSCYYDNETYLYPEVVCDTTYTYTGQIKSIMDRQCARGGCHVGAEPEGGIALTTYEEVKNGVEFENILCNIRQESGCVAMPKNEGRIPACEISAIEHWQSLGFPEN
jgi:hypothetical protein